MSWDDLLHWIAQSAVNVAEGLKVIEAGSPAHRAMEDLCARVHAVREGREPPPAWAPASRRRERTVRQLAQAALDVQDACNLSGVVLLFDEAMIDLWAHARRAGKGTEWVNKHPISQVMADKVAALTDTQSLGNVIMLSEAYRVVRALAGGGSDEQWGGSP